VALAAKRDEITLNVLVSEAFVCLVVNLQPPERAVVQARLAAMRVNRFSGVALAGPLVASDVAAVGINA
jgi:hypothetical protein